MGGCGAKKDLGCLCIVFIKNSLAGGPCAFVASQLRASCDPHLKTINYFGVLPARKSSCVGKNGFLGNASFVLY